MERAAQPEVESEHQRTRTGLLQGIGAYGLWGLIPLYFKAVEQVSPPEVLAHRVVWCLVLLAGIIALHRRWGDLVRALRSRPVLLKLAVSTTLIGINWYTYIYAVATDQILQSSFGYFVTPLMNVLLGVIFLKERLRPYQLLGIVLAAVAVLNLAFIAGQIPWIALVLSVTFAFYGLLRKTVAVDGLLGLFIETLLLLPLCLGYISYVGMTGQATYAAGGATTIILLVLSGPVTAIPLLMFGGAARRLRLSTLGILQYLAPTLQFALAVLAFGEPLPAARLISFGFIWLAVGIYTADSFRSYRKDRSKLIRPMGAPAAVVTADSPVPVGAPSS